MDVPSWVHETTLDAKPVSAPRARAFVCRHLIEHGLGYLVDPIRLVVSELATNAVVHACSSFTVTLSCVDRTVLLEVRDEAPAARIPAQVQRSDLSERGVKIVQILTSEWGVVSDQPGTHTVWASFDLRKHQLT